MLVSCLSGPPFIPSFSPVATPSMSFDTSQDCWLPWWQSVLCSLERMELPCLVEKALLVAPSVEYLCRSHCCEHSNSSGNPWTCLYVSASIWNGKEQRNQQAESLPVILIMSVPEYEAGRARAHGHLHRISIGNRISVGLYSMFEFLLIWARSRGSGCPSQPFCRSMKRQRGSELSNSPFHSSIRLGNRLQLLFPSQQKEREI